MSYNIVANLKPIIILFLINLILGYLQDLEWCCNLMEKFQNIQPHKGLGRYQTLPFQNHNKIKQEEWEIRRCNNLVGGTQKNNCLGENNTFISLSLFLDF